VAPIDESEHDKVCAAKIVPCPAKDVGCLHSSKRSILPKHSAVYLILPQRPILLRLQQLEKAQKEYLPRLRKLEIANRNLIQSVSELKSSQAMMDINDLAELVRSKLECIPSDD
jgi:hypothetical protein